MAFSPPDPLDPPDPDRPGSPGSPGGPLPGDLLAIREQLKRARAERGACPPWDELRADLLPGGQSRPGREQRLAHHAICPYCDAHVVEWRKSADHASDTLGAIERGVARGIVEGAKGLAGKIVTSARAARGGERGEQADEPRHPEPVRPETSSLPTSAPPLFAVPPPSKPAPAVPTYVPPPTPTSTPHRTPSAPTLPATGPRAVPAPSGGLLVVECAPGRVPPDSVFLCAGAMGLEVACVEHIEELRDDPDLSDVQAVIIASDRDPADWPHALRQAKKLVPGRTVLVLSMYGQEPPKGARRALGEALLPVSVSAETLLLALDRRLR
jgi:hypothetical protein